VEGLHVEPQFLVGYFVHGVRAQFRLPVLSNIRKEWIYKNTVL
jgi:hypothetical protein